MGSKSLSPRGKLSNLDITSSIYVELGISEFSYARICFPQQLCDATKVLCALFFTNEKIGVQRLMVTFSNDQPK